MVSQYTGLNILEVSNLDIIDFLILRRDAFITSCNQTEAGREYLDNAYRITLTKPNKSELRNQFGEER